MRRNFGNIPNKFSFLKNFKGLGRKKYNNNNKKLILVILRYISLNVINRFP